MYTSRASGSTKLSRHIAKLDTKLQPPKHRRERFRPSREHLLKCIKQLTRRTSARWPRLLVLHLCDHRFHFVELVCLIIPGDLGFAGKTHINCNDKLGSTALSSITHSYHPPSLHPDQSSLLRTPQSAPPFPDPPVVARSAQHPRYLP